MAHCTISNGITGITGALKKTTEQGVNHITVTRKKHIHDPPAHLAVALHSAAHDDCPGTEAQCLTHGHGGVNTELSGFIGTGGND